MSEQEDDTIERSCIAFEGARRIAFGPLAAAAACVRVAMATAREPVLVFDALTSEPIEVDPRGDPDVVAPRPPGRPKLGVVAREVTLLPRHWSWLNSQPGGASVALRRLVEGARRAGAEADRVRAAQEATYRFLAAMAGNLPAFEEAARALYRADPVGFEAAMRAWPADIREHAARLAAGAFETAAS